MSPDTLEQRILTAIEPIRQDWWHNYSSSINFHEFLAPRIARALEAAVSVAWSGTANMHSEVHDAFIAALSEDK